MVVNTYNHLMAIVPYYCWPLSPYYLIKPSISINHPYKKYKMCSWGDNYGYKPYKVAYRITIKIINHPYKKYLCSTFFPLPLLSRDLRKELRRFSATSKASWAPTCARNHHGTSIFHRKKYVKNDSSTIFRREKPVKNGWFNRFSPEKNC